MAKIIQNPKKTVTPVKKSLTPLRRPPRLESSVQKKGQKPVKK